ncbi:polyphosphate kinase 1 [soil metagenome]
MSSWQFFNRDLSWLSFNERVLQEAANPSVPLLERFKFLSIYSSNLDEFYRVRMPAIMAIQKISKTNPEENIYTKATEIINSQQAEFGKILNNLLIPELKQSGYVFLNNDGIHESISPVTTSYFFTNAAGLIQPILLTENEKYFPGNNELYLAVVVQYPVEDEKIFLIRIPCDILPRFYSISKDNINYILFLEDIICENLRHVFAGATIKGAYNIKITRDAALELEDEYSADLAEKIEQQLKKRAFGFATRFLYQPGIPLRHLQSIIQQFNLQNASVIQGGRHHNLKDLALLPIKGNQFSYPVWQPAERISFASADITLFDKITHSDLMVHAPYDSYNSILRFFNEAAIDASVEAISTTLYRVANDSRIVQALISAAKNGKTVTVLVELKARFDEANNIHWAKKMKDAGVRIIYSHTKLKVHAKVALVKRRNDSHPLLGLLATGNLNESTARFYTDHILLTANEEILKEIEQLFTFLGKGKKTAKEDGIAFNHLLVAQFNLQNKFLALIDREILHAQSGLPASIFIKLNNLEEEVLISKLYEASNAGVKIKLIVRSICRLVPGIIGQSENICIKRIVDRYLEHGRVFIFDNNNNPEIFMGSSDWMNRNIYRRIEVCFPIYNEALKKQLHHLLTLQWQDNEQAVLIDQSLHNVPVEKDGESIRSQEAIYNLLHL